MQLAVLDPDDEFTRRPVDSHLGLGGKGGHGGDRIDRPQQRVQLLRRHTMKLDRRQVGGGFPAVGGEMPKRHRKKQGGILGHWATMKTGSSSLPSRKLP